MFLKQSFGWMVFGELEDPGREFFIQSTSHQSILTTKLNSNETQGFSTFSSRSLADRVANRLHSTDKTSPNGPDRLDLSQFDWTMSFTLCLENLPESHVSPRMAAKMIFVGKAVKLLQVSGDLNELSRQGFQASDVYKYLSTGNAAVEAGLIFQKKSYDSDTLSESESVQLGQLHNYIEEDTLATGPSHRPYLNENGLFY